MGKIECSMQVNATYANMRIIVLYFLLSRYQKNNNSHLV